MCIFFHKWGVWLEYKNNWLLYNKNLKEPVVQYEIRQKRKCVRCGKVQDEFVRGM